ncbi:MAG TPA: hypothetical protein VI953_01975 [Candidatus Paceibacterota bacterium]
MGKARQHILIDLLFIAVSIVLAVAVTKSGLLEELLYSLGKTRALESLIAGLFFTSAFTTAFSIAAISKLAVGASVLWIAFFGAIGAVLGDAFLLTLMRGRLATDIKAMLGRSTVGKIKHILHARLFRIFSPFIGALIIASPLPDEFGLAIFGLSSLSRNYFILFSFLANFTGILVIATITQALGS